MRPFDHRAIVGSGKVRCINEVNHTGFITVAPTDRPIKVGMQSLCYHFSGVL